MFGHGHGQGPDDAAAAGSRFDGRVAIAVSWLAAGALHARYALVTDVASPTARLVAAALALVALVGAVVLLARNDERVVLGAAVAGAVGVGLWFVTTVFPGPAGPQLDWWAFGTVLIDTLTVRLAFFVLRRRARAAGGRASG